MMRKNVLATGVSFLSYFVMASIISPLGIINEPISLFFNIPITEATALFSFLTTGLLIGSFLAMFVFDYMSIKTTVLSQALSVIAVLLIIKFSKSALMLSLSLAIIGVNCGVLLSTAAVVITKLYEDSKRASMLLITDSFYSIGGVVSSFFAGLFLSYKMSWAFAFLPAFVFTSIIAIFAFMAYFPEKGLANELVDKNSSVTKSKINWPKGVFFCGISLFVYMLGMVTLISWVPSFAKTILGAADLESGQLISRFFIGQFISQIIMFFLVHKISMKKLILLCAGFLTLTTLAIWSSKTMVQLNIVMIVLGLIGGGLLKTSLTYGTLLLKKPSTKVVSFLVFCTGLGSSLAPLLSSKIVENGRLVNVLQAASFLYFLMFVFFFAMIFYNQKAISPKEVLN